MGIAALTILAVASMAADNSAWGNFKPGSWTKLKTTSDTTVAGHTTSMSIETKMTLVSKTADKAVVETETTMMGNTTKAKAEIPLKSDAKGTAQTPPKMGSETITVAGKTFKCKTFEIQSEANGMKTSTKTWIADEVPGAIVKSESTSTGSVSSKVRMELEDFKAQ
ncbi:MAG: hypothetical protein ACLQGV_10955 [Bryobacteraceae bacterium]